MTPSSVAVVMTCFNQERWVRQALDSIASQTVVPDQVIVVDGHSSDRSVAVIEDWTSETRFQIQLVRQPRNVGLCANLNTGLSLVEAEFFVPFYSDDWCEPHRVEVLRDALASAGPEVAMACGSIREVDRFGERVADHDFAPRIGPLLTEDPVARMTYLAGGNNIPAPAVMIRTELVRQAGGYDESITIDDYDLWMRLLRTFRVVYVPSIIANYRLLPSSVSRSATGRARFIYSEAAVLHKHLGFAPGVDYVIAERLSRLADSVAGLDAFDLRDAVFSFRDEALRRIA